MVGWFNAEVEEVSKIVCNIREGQNDCSTQSQHNIQVFSCPERTNKVIQNSVSKTNSENFNG